MDDNNRFVVNSFQVSNSLVDDIIQDISGNALKLYMIIIRKTVGWQKYKDKISVSQLMFISGIRDKRTINKSINELLDFGLIKKSKKIKGKINEYSLNNSIKKNISNDDEVVPKNGTTKLGAKNVPTLNKLGTKNVPTTRYKKCTPTKDNTKNIIHDDNLDDKKNKNKEKKNKENIMCLDGKFNIVYQELIKSNKHIGNKEDVYQSYIKIKNQVDMIEFINAYKNYIKDQRDSNSKIFGLKKFIDNFIYLRYFLYEEISYTGKKGINYIGYYNSNESYNNFILKDTKEQHQISNDDYINFKQNGKIVILKYTNKIF